MSYRLKKNEPLAPGIRRIVREQLEGALYQIEEAAAGREAAAVHATRKHIKKVRALLRLIREKLGREIFQEENHRLRDVARTFSGSRDARVQLQLLAKLRAEAQPKSTAFAKTNAALEKEMATHADGFGPQRSEVQETLQRIHDRIEGWPLDELGVKDLCCALRHSYKRGRKCLDEARAESSAENFHSWRKRVKDIWYQARILEYLNRPVMGELTDAAKTLGQHLGNLHDLSFFGRRLEAEGGCRDDERVVLLGLIFAQERELEQVVLDLGARFFAEKPGAFERRLLRYADDWPGRLA